MATLAWLNEHAGQYANKDLVVRHITAAIAAAPTLRPRKDVYTYDDGRTHLLLSLRGLLPISFRSATYNIPVTIWLPFAYPAEPPMVYVVPTTDMLIKPSAAVDLSGRVTIDYLDHWIRKPDAGSLTLLIDGLRDSFSRAPPVYAKPRAQQQSHPHVQQQNIPNTLSPPALPPKPTAQLPSTPSSGPPPYVPVPSPYIASASSTPTPALVPTSAQLPSASNPLRVDSNPPPTPPRPPVPTGPYNWQSRQTTTTAQSPMLTNESNRTPLNPVSVASLPPPLPYAPARSVSRSAFGTSAAISASIPVSPESSVNIPIDRSQMLQYPSQPHLPHPPPLPPAAPVPPGPYASASAMAPPPTTTTSPPNLLDDDAQQSLSDAFAPPQTPAARPPRPPNPETLALHARLHAQLTNSLSALNNSHAAATQQLLSLQQALLAGAPAIQDEKARLEAVKSVCLAVGERLQAVVTKAEANLEEVKRKGEPNVDELVVAGSIVHNQLLNLVAEDNAIEDTIYHLHRALNSGRIDLERFLRTTRLLAEEQFQKRALMEKILRGLPMGGLSV